MDSEQQEEFEVLQSIYEGDENFKTLETTKFTYKVSEGDDELKHFLVEISWPAQYPRVLPEINLDVFFNKHLSENTKSYIQSALLEQARTSLGNAVTFTLFEWAKENSSELMANNDPGTFIIKGEEEGEAEGEASTTTKDSNTSIKPTKKEVLSKAQKRRRAANLGEKPRGWNWVDIVKVKRILIFF
ncbi:RWD domain-containing protein 4-like isoform X2 [Corticium candelabrum]|uniref:RWD domain-containing protein 4-like isoform X2 n=1 Tax=Corticium candelabrum TaxID=121492 RepID=UPI002E260236|nr:RWD domain-containing protein 4-like isoform X2 [Corticium candelabrum]